MNFETIFKSVLSENERFSKLLTVDSMKSQFIEAKFVNIRLFWKNNNNLVPTRSGICLKENEFRPIINLLELRQPFNTNLNDRFIAFRETERKFLYELELTKPDGKTQKLIIIDNEIQALIDIKEEIIKKLE